MFRSKSASIESSKMSVLVRDNKNGLFLCQNCPRKFLLQVVFSNHLKNSHKPEEELKQDHIMKNGVLQIEKQNSTVSFANPYLKEESRNKFENNPPEKAFQALNAIDHQGESKREPKEKVIVDGELPKFKDSIKKKLKVHQSLDPKQCPECKKLYKNRFRLKLHVNLIHKKIKTFECNDCKKEFEAECFLLNHVKFVHKKTNRFPCEVCHKPFQQKSDKEKHIQTVHKKLKPYHCLECGKKFGYKNYFQIHINNVHMKLKPHKCLDCSASFGALPSLDCHINRVHRKFFPFKCQDCNKEFVRKINYEYHINSKYVQKKFHKQLSKLSKILS